PIAEQEELYDLIEREYVEYVERQEAMGESILEAQSLDFDARTIAQMEVVASDPSITSQFTSSVYLDVVDVKTLRKPFTTQEAVNFVRRNLDLAEVSASFNLYEVRPEISEAANDRVASQVQALRQATEQYRVKFQVRVPPKSGEEENETQLRTNRAIDKFNSRLDQQLSHVQKTLQTFPSGTPVRIVTANESIFYGIAARIWNTDPKGNPTAPGNWKIQFLLADPAKELTIPLSKVNVTALNAIAVVPKEYDFFDEPIYEVFDQRQRKNREERQIFAGNTLRAMEKFNGKMINYTNSQGRTCQGVLTPVGFDIEKVLEHEPIQIMSPVDVMRFLFEITNRTGHLKTPDEILTVRAQKRRDGNGIILQTPKAREEGGQYYLNKALMEAAGGGEFFSVGKKMMLVVPAERIESVIHYLNAADLSLAAFDQRQKARDMLGIELPRLELIQQNQFEAQADYVPYVPPVDAQAISALEQAFQVNGSAIVEPTLEDITQPETTPIELLSSESTTDSSTQELWALRLDNLSDELKSLLQPSQIVRILTQADPLAAIQKLKEAQPIFAAIYQELADLYTTAAMNSPQDSSTQEQKLPETSLTALQTQLITSIDQIPNTWALTPIDAHKAPYRAGWQTEPPLSRDELRDEIRNSASGYGLRTGSISGGIVAIDLDGASARAKMLELSGGIDLPETVSFTSGREGRSQHLFVVPRELWSLIRSRKIATGIKGEEGKEEHVELRWQGLQSVLPPSVHPTTGQYRWLKSPQEVEIALVPNWVIDRMLVETKMVTVDHALSFNHPPVQANWTDQDWALSYLAALHPHRADDRDIWLKVGMALHSVSPTLFSAWDQWSAQSQKYRPGECEYIWNRFQENGGITIATLGGWAKEDGWRFPVEAEVKANSESKVIDPVQAFQQQLDQHDPKTGEWLAISEPHYPCLQEFKRWYFEAREVGRSQKYLDRIQELAEDFKAKTPDAIADSTAQNSEITLSEAAISHLKKDSSAYQTQIEQFAKDVKTILKYRGKQISLQGQPVYEYQSHNQNYLLRYYCVTKSVTVEKSGRLLLQYPVTDHTHSKLVMHEDFACFSREATRLREQAKVPPSTLNLTKSNEQQR
ncbi:MAG: bifunctional DNA primase/polymerase, partial [Leptolyngbya sp. Prado105]|nr:bifunctional DNA primase/polymerase [Leptolyngbya sp. Prado105]